MSSWYPVFFHSGEKCGEGLGTCEDDHDGDDHGGEGKLFMRYECLD